MIQIFARYPNNGRGLRRLITILLKKKLVDSVEVLNYGKHYELVENKIQKTEQKYLIFQLSLSQKENLLNQLNKLDPSIDIIILTIE